MGDGSRSQKPNQVSESSLNDTNEYSTSGKEARDTEVATFHNEVAVQEVSISQGARAEAMGSDDVSNLEHFMKRPVKLFKTDWTQTAVLDVTNHSLEDMFNIETIGRKLANFRNMSGELVIKIVHNGNPFYYGRCFALWTPYSRYRNSVANRDNFSGRSGKMRASTRMHGMLDPSDSSPVMLRIPFFFPKHTLNIMTKHDAREFGALHLVELNPLQHSNGSTSGINITVFAWIENIQLGGPTSKLSEFTPAVSEKGTVYKIASKTGTASGMFTNVPYIGPYASALEKSSMALAKVGKLFGWSKPEKETGEFMLPQSIDDIAQTDGKDAVKRLVGDTQQGLTIDPRTVGLNGADSLALSAFTERQSFFSTVIWSSTTPSETRLLAQLVDPGINFFFPSNNSHQYTPMGVCGLSHSFWTGNCKFRVEVVASEFHKGRLLIQYDPETASSANLNTNNRYSHVMDISDCKDAVFDIGWGQNTAFREISPPDYPSDTPEMSDVDFGNGYLSIYVLNELVGPQTTSNVEINLYVGGGADMRFGAPSGAFIPRITLVEPPVAYQSPAGLQETHTVVFQGSPVSDGIFHEHFGETTQSFRSLMKRYNFNRREIISPIVDPGPVDNTEFGLRYRSYPVPLKIYERFTPENVHDKVLDAGVYWTNTATTLINLIGACFLGTRGGIRWLTAPHITMRTAVGGVNDMELMYYVGRSEVATDSSVVAYVTPLDRTTLNAMQSEVTELCQQSAFLVDGNNNHNVKVEIPFYSPYRFSEINSVDPVQMQFVDGYYETSSLQVEGVINNTRKVTDVNVDMLVSVAEDFDFLWFQSVPQLYFTNLG